MEELGKSVLDQERDTDKGPQAGRVYSDLRGER